MSAEQDGANDPNGIDWTDAGTPRAAAFDDVYYSDADGRAECEHVFLAGNGLPDRWRGQTRFAIAELGFGTGLNALTTLALWRRTQPSDAVLDVTSFEAHPLSAEDMRRALSRWPDLARDAEALLADWPPPPGFSTRALGPMRLTLAIGDANALLPDWRGRADAWFLDGFNPAKNPELWNADLMLALAARTAPGGSFATYTAAGWVRRNLVAAGFAVEKRKGFGAKREMMIGRRAPRSDAPSE